MTEPLSHHDHIHRCRVCGISWECQDWLCGSPAEVECYRCGYHREIREHSERNGYKPQMRPLIHLKEIGR